jgi:hypothetical protein
MNQVVEQLRLGFRMLVLSLFEKHGGSRFQTAIFYCTAVALYVFGLLQWARFCNYGKITFESADWYKEFGFYSVIHNAFSEGVVPYHIDHIIHGTNRFLALPEIVLSPQILTLKYSDSLGLFVLIHLLVLFSVGFAGCLAIHRHFALSSFSFVLLTGLFSFNGYITSHFAVGHTMWGGYFFLPWFFLVLISITEGHRNALRQSLRMSIVLFLILLQGSLHVFVGCLVYLILFGLFNRRQIKIVASAMIGSLILSSYRIIPAALSLKEHELFYQSGYPTLRDVFDGFTVIKQPSIEMIGGLTGQLYWWELDYFIGLGAFLFVVYFGILKPLSIHDLGLKFTSFSWPNFLIAVFAVSHFFSPIANLPIPFASVERVPSRFLIFALVPLVVFSCVRLDGFFRNRREIVVVHWLAIFGIVQTYFELLTHLRFWNIQNVNASLPRVAPLTIDIVSVPGEVLYLSSVRVSVVASISALVVWVALMVRNHRVG